ncbi:hypothetical protein KEM54_002676 [Ascosphaera aggregata]|nr:hypothetical protein KEM54_002676 [Ascosphaera aggregata]
MSSVRDVEVATAARLQFLKSAARHIHPHSPSTSSHLLLTHHHILLEKMKPVAIAQLKEYCSACGSLRMPDCPKTPYKEKPNMKRRRRKQQRRHSVESSTIEQSTRSGTSYECQPSENAGSKQRAKARKQQGLLASLQAKKAQQQSSSSSAASSTSLSMNLLDFLQP